MHHAKFTAIGATVAEISVTGQINCPKTHFYDPLFGEERYWSGRLLSPTLIEEGRLVSESDP